ncbi:MAG: hypothetical protein HUK20_14690 [Fibrobacter sp.]|nr:hypothetical protein [Fibrobacter sp.]
MEQAMDTTVVDTLAKAAQNAAAASAELSTSGILFMVGSWAAIIALCAFCFAKVLKGKDAK